MKIKDLFHFEKGVLQSSKCIAGDYNFITAASEWKTHSEYTHDCEALIFAAAASGSLGRTHYVNGKFISSDLCFIITPKDPINFPVDLKFYHLIFEAFKTEIVRNTKAGTSKEAIGLTAFGKYELPYFNIDKQLKTKNKFVEIQESTTGLDLELTHQQALVKQLRQAFLREAMQGKLVPQDASEGNAKDLLEQIKAEKDLLIQNKKIKAGKLQEAELIHDLIFDIPATWSWCNLDDICYNITDGTHQTPSYTNSGRIFLSAQNIKPFRFMPEEHKFVSEDAYQEYINNKKPEKGDILVARVGAGIGEAAVINQEIEFCFYVSLGLVQPFKDFVDSDYLTYVINSPYGVRYAKGNISSKGGSAGNFNLGRIRSFQIPLPPLSEQHRIVAKLDELMAYCDQLEESIKNSQAQNELLLQQVLREALRPLETKIEEPSNVVPFIVKKCTEPEKAILAGHIINITNTEDFGRVKFQKLLHLTEYYCKIELGSNYIQKRAGPHDGELLNSIETTLKRYKYFEIKQENRDNHRVNYMPLPSAPELDELFAECFKEEAESINKFLTKFKKSTWEQCEIVSTLYAVWNNRLIKELDCADEYLFQDFLKWDSNKAKYKDRLENALAWMRNENIIPNGWGKYIEKQNE